MSVSTGTYYPNRPGARTLAEARAMYIGHEPVSGQMAPDGTATVFVGCRIAYNGPAPESVNTPGEFHDWIVTVAETFANGPEEVEDNADALTETEIANLKGTRYLAAFVDANYGMPQDDRAHELFRSIGEAKDALWRRAVDRESRVRYVDTALDADLWTRFPSVTDDAEIMLYAFDVVNGEIVREEYPTHRLFMGPRGGIKVERL
jgi:arylsulfatase A-like enzyme